MGILKSLEIASVAMGIVIGMYNPTAGKPSIEASIRPDSLTIGDKFLYINKIPISPGAKIEPSPLTDKLGEANVISDIQRLEYASPDTAAFACSLAVYKTGKFEIPTLTFTLSDSAGNKEEIPGDSLQVNVHSILSPDSTQNDTSQIADIKGPYRMPGPLWPFFVFPLIALVTIGAIYFLHKRTELKQRIPQSPPRPPWEVALEKLDVLKNERHYDFGRIKIYYFELSLIVREYLENRYEFPAVERTTIELHQNERSKAIGNGYFGRLFEFFDRADLAKFAKGSPPRFNADSDLEFVYEFVNGTIPASPVTDTVNIEAKEDSKSDVQV